MSRNKSRYQKMESVVSTALCVDAVSFLAYMICAGIGLLSLKITCTVICLIISGLILCYLFMTRELLRKRSLWMTLAAACIIICLLVSLILQYPSPAYSMPKV